MVGAFGYAELASTAKVAGGDFSKWTPEQLDILHRAQPGIAVAAGWVPAALGVIAAVIIFFYPLTADQHSSLVGDLNERRAKRAAARLRSRTRAAISTAWAWWCIMSCMNFTSSTE